MKAASITAVNQVEVGNVPNPEPKAHEILVQVARSGVCGTDVHIFKGEFRAKYPLIPGHEISGTIAALGPEVEGFRVGEPVVIDPNIHCGTCHFCRLAKFSHCQRMEAVGVTMAGGMAEYVVAPESQVYPIEGLDLGTAVFVEPLSCVIYGHRRIRIALGEDVLIFGAGPIGLCHVQVARHMGAGKLAIVDRYADKLEIALELGASHSIEASEGLADRLRSIAPHGFDVVIDATGVPEVVESLPQYTKNAGRILYFGVCPKESQITIDPFDVYVRDLEIYGSSAPSMTFPPAISLLQQGVVKVSPLVSHTLPLEEFPSALELVGSREARKILIAP